MIRKIFVATVLLVLFMPMIARMTGMEKISVKPHEQTVHVPPMEWAFEEPKVFINHFTRWFENSFGFRNDLFRLYSQIKYRYLKISPLPDRLLVGKDGWLFSNGIRSQRLRSGKDLYSQADLERLSEKLEMIKKRLVMMNIRFYLAIAPSKESACPELIPERLGESQISARKLQVMEFLRKRSFVKVIDLMGGFPNGNVEFLFRKGDPHWNEVGGYYAGRHLLDAIRIDYPKLKIADLNDFEVRELALEWGGFSRMINLPIEETFLRLIPRDSGLISNAKSVHPVPDCFGYGKENYENRYTNRDSSGMPKAMFIHDSFVLNMRKILNPSFRETIFFRRDNHCDWWNWDLISQERPDLLVLQFSEVHLDYLLDSALDN